MKPPDPRRARFIEEYAIDGSAVAAARRAGYPETTARKHAYRLLQRPEIAAAIAAGEARTHEAATLTAQRVLREAARIAFADIRRLLRPDGTLKDIAEFDPDMAAAVASVVARKSTGGRRVRLRSKPAALALLGRHLKLWRRVENGLEGLAEDIAAARKAAL